jgi:hypothetical protein
MFLFRPPVEKMEASVLGLPLNDVKLFRAKDYLRKIERELANYDRLTQSKNKLAKCEFCKAILNKKNLHVHAEKCPVQIGLREIEYGAAHTLSLEREKEIAKEEKDKKINIPVENYANLGASYSAENRGNSAHVSCALGRIKCVNKKELAVNVPCHVLTEENHRCLKYLRRLYCTK